ncbi:Pentatricopeptide repeat-containing protein [Thalictrum thalictroides]|uniref:Pentatricopeptide repeat-containing protein n=1 Tax=Thalictrum thalictroides TaxID=46969 RepID=A0A7J6W5A0_THATH|nr:Pentatricopeptide repeat-containing protein [Thalictrum thalictroides]
MHCNKVEVDYFAFPPVLKSCACSSAIKEGRQVHSLVISYGFDSNSYIQSGLIDFYAKGGDLESAKRVFDGILVKDPVSYNCLISGYSKSGEVSKAEELFSVMSEKTIVSWNSMMSCYLQNGDFHEGFRIFERMQVEKCKINEFTLATVLSICAKLGDLEKGLGVTKFIENNSLLKNMFVSTAILEMYVKCGAVDEARREFDKMTRRDVVAWSAMIAGYAQNGKSNEALELFDDMINAKLKPNDVTLVSVISACGQLGSVDAGKRIGNYIETQGFASNVYVVSALLDMYAKCGNITKARHLFNQMTNRDIVSWNSMIGGLAYNGLAKEAIELFTEMKDAKVKPNEITFMGLLTACTHAGLIERGCAFFRSMKTDYNIVPKVQHCACIVDLYCRSGLLQEAYTFITKMETEPNVVIWGILLSACRINLNVDLAERAVEKLLLLEPENSGNYVLLANIYSIVGRWQDALKIRNLMKDKRLQKTSAYSWIEGDDTVHKFLVGDTSHPMSDEIYDVADGLGLQLQLVSRIPEFDLELS